MPVNRTLRDNSVAYNPDVELWEPEKDWAPVRDNEFRGTGHSGRRGGLPGISGRQRHEPR